MEKPLKDKCGFLSSHFMHILIYYYYFTTGMNESELAFKTTHFRHGLARLLVLVLEPLAIEQFMTFDVSHNADGFLQRFPEAEI